jgi:hypothetical protein
MPPAGLPGRLWHSGEPSSCCGVAVELARYAYPNWFPFKRALDLGAHVKNGFPGHMRQLHSLSPETDTFR